MSQLDQLNRFLATWRNNQGSAPRVYNSENGEIVHVEGYSLVLSGSNQVVLRANNGIVPDHSVGINLLTTAAQRVDAFYVGTNYRQVLENHNWQTIYQVMNRPWYEIHGTNQIIQNGQTVPCHSCGLVVPLQHITVDHKKPRTGGESTATIKLLRSLGCYLTHDGPVGAKNRALVSGNITAIGTKAARVAVTHEYRRAERYTLTENGIVFLSLAYAASGSQLLNYAMHSLTNLVPMCFRCNAQKNNGQVDLSQINY